MAIDFVTEIWEGRDGRTDRSGVRAYTRMFQVRTDTFTDDAKQVIDAVDPSTLLAIPSLGDSFGLSDQDAIVTSVAPRQQSEDPRIWTVTVSYSSDTGSNSGQAVETEDPIARAPVESFGFEKTTVPLEKDADGDPVVNSAGDRFDPLPEVERSFPVLSIQRNEAGFQYATATTYVDTLNDAPFRGVPAGDARMIDISAQQRFENGVAFFSVTYRIAFRREGWDVQPLDRGFRKLLVGPPTRLEKIMVQAKDASGNLLGEEVPSEPPFLNGLGDVLPDGGTPVFLTFQPYPEADWSVLNL